MENERNGRHGTENRQTDSGWTGTADRSDNAGNPESDGGTRMGDDHARDDTAHSPDFGGLVFSDNGRGHIEARSGQLFVGSINYSPGYSGGGVVWRIHAVRMNWIAQDLGLARTRVDACRALADNWQIWLKTARLEPAP